MIENSLFSNMYFLFTYTDLTVLVFSLIFYLYRLLIYPIVFLLSIFLILLSSLLPLVILNQTIPRTQNFFPSPKRLCPLITYLSL